MLIRRSLALLLLIGSLPLSAQQTSDAMRCAAGTLTFADGDPQPLRAWADSLLLYTPQAYPQRFGSTARDGLRALVMAADSLSAHLHRFAPRDSAQIAAVRRVLAGAERAFGQHADSLSAATDLLTPFVSPTVPNTVEIAELRLSLAPDARVTSTGLCIIADAAAFFLKEHQLAGAQAHQQVIATAAARWDLYATQAPSMTLLERWGASCRLWKLSWLFVGRRCPETVRRADLKQAIAAPTWRSVMLHPRPTVRPILSADSAYTAGALLEVYGIVRHQYTKRRLLTWGASWAITRPPVGREQYAGGVLYLGPVTASVFWNDGKPLWMVSPDVIGWFADTRSSMRALGSASQP